ncbi:hypothetical protein FSP39_004502 [Pinctada imbricata]|uniref:Uncharacterized protein n=1 Tax=Pinctada imbricata TaxID=66713 RepID=A0AA88Y4V2_PINIB|nr:hypothetical protein FSP39_004502 [Pinctada imbricata]
MFTANYTDGYYAGFVSYPGCAPVQTWHYSKQYGFEESQYVIRNFL